MSFGKVHPAQAERGWPEAANVRYPGKAAPFMEMEMPDFSLDAPKHTDSLGNRQHTHEGNFWLYFAFLSTSTLPTGSSDTDKYATFTIVILPITNNQIKLDIQFCWLSFSCSVVFNSLQPQHARLPCPSPSPRVGSNSCPLNW